MNFRYTFNQLKKRVSCLLALTIYSLTAFIQSANLFQSFNPLKYAENLKLPNYHIQHTYKIDSTSFILIGRPTEHDPKDEGLRLIYLINSEGRYQIKYVSGGRGESYIYKPSFYQRNNKILIVCELGAEYSWGMDVFLLEDHSLEKLGFMNVAASINGGDHPESAVSILQIQENDGLEFSFPASKVYQGIKVEKINLIYKPGQAGQLVMSTNSIKYMWNGSWKLLNKHD